MFVFIKCVELCYVIRSLFALEFYWKFIFSIRNKINIAVFTDEYMVLFPPFLFLIKTAILEPMASLLQVTPSNSIVTQ